MAERRTQAKTFDPLKGITWTAETEVEVIKKLVREKERIFAEHRKLENGAATLSLGDGRQELTRLRCQISNFSSSTTRKSSCRPSYCYNRQRSGSLHRSLLRLLHRSQASTVPNSRIDSRTIHLRQMLFPKLLLRHADSSNEACQA